MFFYCIKPVNRKVHFALSSSEKKLHQLSVCLCSSLWKQSLLSLFLNVYQPSVQPFTPWMEPLSAVTLFPSWRSLGTTSSRKLSTGSRSHAPSGTPTNKSRGSFGWSIRTSAKVRGKKKANIECVLIVHSGWKHGHCLYGTMVVHFQILVVPSTAHCWKRSLWIKNFSVLNNRVIFLTLSHPSPLLCSHLDKMLFCASICHGLKCCFARVPCLYTAYGSLRQHASLWGGLPQLLSR